jgi:hypothetical protein
VAEDEGSSKILSILGRPGERIHLRAKPDSEEEN